MKKRADGRFCKTVTINGKRQFIYGDTQEEVEEKYIDLKLGLRKGLSLNDKTTLGEMAQEWYETYIKDKKAQKTQDMYKTVINNHVAAFEDYKLKDIKPIMIEKYLKKLNKSKSLEHKVKITFNQIFKAAKQNKLIDYNPIEYVKAITPDNPKRQCLSDFERDIVLDALKDHTSYLWVLTLLYTGMREGEVLALTWKDIDEKNCVLNVDKAIEWVHCQPRLKQPKTKAGIRQIPIPDMLLQELLKEKERNKDKSIYIFHRKDNKPHLKSSAEDLWKEAKAVVNKYVDEVVNKNIENEKDKVNINLTFRLLRHTYATALYDAGIDLKSAQEILGHADFKITMDIYTHIQNERREKNVIKIQELYKKKETEKAAESS